MYIFLLILLIFVLFGCISYNINIKNIENFEIKKNTIVAIPINQLGNVLRFLISMKIVADHYGYNFYIDTSISNHTRIREKKIIETLFQKYLKSENLKYTEYNEDIFNYIDTHGTTSSPLIEGYCNDICKNAKDKVIGIKSIYAIIPIDMNIKTYVKEKIKLYKSLNWPKLLLKELEEFAKKNDLYNRIGIHIRNGDNKTDKLKQNINTSIDIFYNKIDDIKKEKILILSDDDRILENIKNKYKDRDIVFANKTNLDLHQGLYEMMLLSRTKHIIGSYASTFSYEAAFFIGTNIELYSNNKWIKYDIKSLYNT